MAFEQEHTEEREQLQKQLKNERIQRELDLAIAQIENEQIQRALDAAIESLDQEDSHQEKNTEEQVFDDHEAQQSSSTEEELASDNSVTEEYLENTSSKHDHNMTIEHQDQASYHPITEEEVFSQDSLIDENSGQQTEIDETLLVKAKEGYEFQYAILDNEVESQGSFELTEQKTTEAESQQLNNELSKRTETNLEKAQQDYKDQVIISSSKVGEVSSGSLQLEGQVKEEHHRRRLVETNHFEEEQSIRISSEKKLVEDKQDKEDTKREQILIKARKTTEVQRNIGLEQSFKENNKIKVLQKQEKRKKDNIPREERKDKDFIKKHENKTLEKHGTIEDNLRKPLWKKHPKNEHKYPDSEKKDIYPRKYLIQVAREQEVPNNTNLKTACVLSKQSEPVFDVDKFITMWNKHVEKEKPITDEMKKVFSNIFMEYTNLVRVRLIDKGGEWTIIDLGDFPAFVKDKMQNLKKSTFVSHIYWIKAKKIEKRAPFYFIEYNGETFLLTNSRSIFPSSGLNAKDFGRYRRFIDTIAELIDTDVIKNEIIKEFNKSNEKRWEVAHLPNRQNAKFVYKLKYDPKVLEDYLAQSYYDYFKTGYKIQRKTMVVDYFGTPEKPKIRRKYEFAYYGFASFDFRFNVYAANESKALQELIRNVLKDKNIHSEIQNITRQLPNVSSEYAFYLALKKEFLNKPTKLLRKWNWYRFKNARRVLFKTKNSTKTSIYTSDLAKERGRYISDNLKIFFHEPKNGSITQLIEALAEEKGFRKALNEEPFNLELIETVRTASIGHNTGGFASNIASIPDIGIYPQCSNMMEFGLVKLQKGELGVRGERVVPHLEEIAKSFTDPNYGTRTFTFNLFPYSHLMKFNNSSKMPGHLIEDVKENEAGVIVMGYWCEGPDWMSRFGEVYNAIRLAAFCNKTGRRSVKDIDECMDEVIRWVSGGEDVLEGRERLTINPSQWEVILSLLELESYSTIIRWTTNVIIKLITKYFEYINSIQVHYEL